MARNVIDVSHCIPRTKYVWGILWFSRHYAASAFRRLRDNLKNPYRISIFDMWIDIGVRIAGKQDWPGSIIYGPPRAPPNNQKCNFVYLVAHIWKTVSYFFPLLYICLLCDEVLLPWNFRSPGFDVRTPPPPQIWKKEYIFVIFWV